MPIKTFLSPIATFASSGAQSLVVGNPGENGQIILWSSPPLGLQPFSKSFPPGILKVWERKDFSREWCHIWETYVRCFGRSRSNWVPVLSQRPPWKYPCSELDTKGDIVWGRVEICRDRHDQRSCKICTSCVNFLGNQRDVLHSLRRTTRFTHTKCDFALKLLNFTHSVKS